MRWTGEVFHDPFMEWMDYNYRFGLDFDLNDDLKVYNYKWEYPEDENLSDWDGRFNENYDSDAMENGGVYGFSEDEENDEIDLKILRVKTESKQVDPAGNDLAK